MKIVETKLQFFNQIKIIIFRVRTIFVFESIKIMHMRLSKSNRLIEFHFWIINEESGRWM